MNPTVSEKTIRHGYPEDMTRVVESSVVKSMFSVLTSALVSRLNRVDLPAFVYPTSATLNRFCRFFRCVER